jgi:hypothetical protein
VCGSRVGGTGRVVCGAGGTAGVCPAQAIDAARNPNPTNRAFPVIWSYFCPKIQAKE